MSQDNKTSTGLSLSWIPMDEINGAANGKVCCHIFLLEYFYICLLLSLFLAISLQLDNSKDS